MNRVNFRKCNKEHAMKVKKPKQRVVWGFNPITRVVQSKKRYSRKNYKIEKEIG